MPLCVNHWDKRTYPRSLGSKNHDHLAAKTRKNRDHLAAHPYNKTYSLPCSCNPFPVDSEGSGARPKRRATVFQVGGFTPPTPPVGYLIQGNGQFLALWINRCRPDKRKLLRRWSGCEGRGKAVTSRCVIGSQSRPKPLGSSTPWSCSTRSRRASTSSRRSAVELSARLAGRLSFQS